MPDLTKLSKAQLNAIADEIYLTYKGASMPPSASALIDVVDTELSLRMYIARAQANGRWPE